MNKEQAADLPSAPAYLEHLDQLDRWFAASRTAAVPCAKGCSACCHGPFDISPADAQLVNAAVQALPAALRETVRQRASEHRAMMTVQLPEWSAPWDVEHHAEEHFDAACNALAQLPCPLLDADGSCLVHAARPATCRITGLAMALPNGDLLENVCPIQGEYPAYEAMAPSLFDLLSFESEAELHDVLAQSGGWVTTTIAGAIR